MLNMNMNMSMHAACMLGEEQEEEYIVINIPF
jgi:hypothetical protein